MRKQYILIGYLVFFFAVVSFYDAYKSNTVSVAIAAGLVTVVGLLAWVWSAQPPRDKSD